MLFVFILAFHKALRHSAKLSAMLQQIILVPVTNNILPLSSSLGHIRMTFTLHISADVFIMMT